MTADSEPARKGKKTAEESLARLLSGRADRYAHETAAPLYELGDDLFSGEDVDLEHVFDFYARVEETHALLLSELEPLVDADHKLFDAIARGTDVATLLAFVAKEFDEAESDVVRQRIDAARHSLNRADELLSEIEHDLADE